MRKAALFLRDYRPASRGGRAFFCGAPSMGALLWVKVPSRVDHNERSEAQLHEGDRVWAWSEAAGQ